MRFSRPDGCFFELNISNSNRAARTDTPERDIDVLADWILLDLHMRYPDGERFKTDPCFLLCELWDLLYWFEAVLHGEYPEAHFQTLDGVIEFNLGKAGSFLESITVEWGDQHLEFFVTDTDMREAIESLRQQLHRVGE